MAFGNIEVGSSFEAVLRIYNRGTATLTVTGITVPAGYSSSWTSGAIAPGESQASTIRFSPAEEQTYNGTLTVNADHTSGTNTMAISGTGVWTAGPRTQFGPGQYLVGIGVAAGRYYSDPAYGCYWERQSGLGGAPGDILSKVYVGFDAGQWIVDILPSDRAFKTDAECRTWFNTARRELETNISPGVWLVGSQVRPGVYSATVNYGCYWERLRGFTMNSSDVIGNDYVRSASQQWVEVRAGDVGFSSDGDCGTWTPSQSLATSEADSVQSLSRIEANRAQKRQKDGPT